MYVSLYKAFALIESLILLLRKASLMEIPGFELSIFPRPSPFPVSIVAQPASCFGYERLNIYVSLAGECTNYS